MIKLPSSLLLTGQALVFGFCAVSAVRAEPAPDSAPGLTDLRTDFRDHPLAVESARSQRPGFCAGRRVGPRDNCLAFPEYADRYNPPALRAELEVEYEDGTREVFATDESWKQGVGGLLASNYWLGEIHDAAAEPSGWDEAGFVDSAWVAPATRTEPVGHPVSLAQSIQPQRVIRSIQPVAVKEPQPGVWVFEFPETFAGLTPRSLAMVKMVTFFTMSETLVGR